MKKIDICKEFQIIAKESGMDLTLKDVEQILDIFDSTVINIANKLEKKDNDKFETANLGCVTVSKVERKGRKGTSELGGKVIDWETPAKEIITLKLKKSFEKEHEIEI